jgi:hypothetical protein
VGGFAHALKQSGYYTANESDYAAALRSQVGGPSSTPAAPSIPDLNKFFDSASLTRISNALAESALRIASPDQT